MKKDDCLFCKIANGDSPSRTLYEDDRFKVILDIFPLTKGHALILPKEHFTNIYELPDEWCADVMKLAKKMSVMLKEKLGGDGINIQSNNEIAAGQTIFHIHIHLNPRYKDDEKLAHSVIALKPSEPTEVELDEVLKCIQKAETKKLSC